MKGFTLAETVIVVALTGVIGVALGGMIANFYRQNAFVLEATTAVNSATRGMERAIETLREASYGEDGAYPIQTAATSSITFFGDADGDGTVERVRLYLVNGTFYQGLTNAAGNPSTYTGQPEVQTVIATYVKNATSTPIFRYFGDPGVELTGTINLSRVRSVQTRLDVDVNPQRAPNILRLESSATLRNLRSL